MTCSYFKKPWFIRQETDKKCQLEITTCLTETPELLFTFMKYWQACCRYFVYMPHCFCLQHPLASRINNADFISFFQSVHADNLFGRVFQEEPSASQLVSCFYNSGMLKPAVSFKHFKPVIIQSVERLPVV